MALISTYWGLVRPLRHHFRTGSQAATASKEHLRNRSTIPLPNEEDAAIDNSLARSLARSLACPCDGTLRRTRERGEGSGGPVRWKPLAAMPAFNHPPLGNAATPATRGKSRHSSYIFSSISNHACGIIFLNRMKKNRIG